MTKPGILIFFTVMLFSICGSQSYAGQKEKKVKTVRPVTIPVTVSLDTHRSGEEFVAVDLSVLEDGESQQILNIRGSANNPLSLTILIQDNLVASISNEIKTIADFIRRLPKGTRVMVGYMQSGTLQVRQKFTTDLERAAKALRIPLSQAGMAPYTPFDQTIDALRRFESLPLGRRAILMITDGLDLSQGSDSLSSLSSLSLQRAINDAQRRSVAIYSIYVPSTGGTNESTYLTSNAQGALTKLSDETGGHAFFQGSMAPISFDPFLKELATLLSRQIALTYLSTHANKGFHRIEVKHKDSKLKIRHPPSYTRK
jgi:VWFA-related protein